MFKRQNDSVQIAPFLVDENLYRGPLPDQRIFCELQKVGVIRLVTLCDESFAARETRQTCARLGLDNVHIPLSPFYRPEQTDINKFLALLEERHQTPTYVHCIHGRDRTGIMLGIYRISQGWTQEAALAEMQHYGFCMDFTALLGAFGEYASAAKIRVG